jgi:ribosomal protein S18 acetylase RimI-like enzyme
MEASDDNAYALVSEESAVVGFGQVLPRADNVVHLCRLIVDPAFRGQGMGRYLCIALMNMGTSKYQADHFTLNVCESNTAALRLYRSLGFDATERIDSGVIGMVWLPTVSSRSG